MHAKLCSRIFFFVISLKKVWKFGYLINCARIKFREFVFAKNFAGINFHEIAQNLGNSRKLLSAKITSFKVMLFRNRIKWFNWDDDFMSQRIDIVKHKIHILFIDKNIIDIQYSFVNEWNIRKVFFSNLF